MNRIFKSPGWVLLYTLVAALLFTGCSDDDEDMAGIYFGNPVTVGQGSVRSWVTTDVEGTPTSIGVTFTEAAVSATGLGNAMRMFVIPLPNEANQTLYDHVMLDWNPQGHEPPGLYDRPHFDLHFYMISEAEVAAIVGQTTPDEEPASQFVPANYILTPGVVPGMGAHWIDVSDANNAPGGFAKNFIYGSIDGNFIFHEPMFTLDYLNSLRTSGTETIAIPQPTAYQKPGLYPQRYSYSYNNTTKEFTISLLDLTMKQ